mmetsp:Transcript_24209/g.81623  ORF Transcript_24209/g.81623 Transcript_24209/m.81623 type:complete len:217 (-) Transcript_24209:125-775(-)
MYVLRISAMTLVGMLSLSYVFSREMKALSLSIFCDVGQKSFTFFDGSSASGTLTGFSPSMTQMASATSLTVAGGFASLRTSSISEGLIVSSAFNASFRAGMASSRSAWTSSTCFWTTSASFCAAAASRPTTDSSCRTPGSLASISAINLSVSICDCFRTGCRSVSSCCIVATLDSAEANCSRPLLYRSRCPATVARLFPSASLKARISSKYDVGVT